MRRTRLGCRFDCLVHVILLPFLRLSQAPRVRVDVSNSKYVSRSAIRRCPLLYPHSPPYPNQHRPISRDRPAAGSFTQTGEPDMTTHMSNKRSGTLPLPKTTVRQTTTHDNRAPRPPSEKNFWPPSRQDRTAYRLAHIRAALPYQPALPCPACQPLCLACHPLTTIIHPSSIHLQSHPVCNICILPPTRGGPADCCGQGLNLPKRKCLAR